MTGAQTRAARALLGWTQQDLAERAKVGVRTVKRFEAGEEITQVVSASIERAFLDERIIAFTGVDDLYGRAISEGVAILSDR